MRDSHGGTLFLDEIGDLPRDSQAALLRVVQEREVVPVGATRPLAVDIRIVVATHRPLHGMAERGEFRRDLFARVAGFTVRLPSLRQRKDDLGILLASILRRRTSGRGCAVSFASEAARALLEYDWPLNIRELEQCVATALALAQDGRIECSHLPTHVVRALERPTETTPETFAARLGDRNERLQVELLAQLARHNGNLAEVARSMGKARMQIHRWCKRFSVDPNSYRP